MYNICVTMTLILLSIIILSSFVNADVTIICDATNGFVSDGNGGCECDSTRELYSDLNGNCIRFSDKPILPDGVTYFDFGHDGIGFSTSNGEYGNACANPLSHSECEEDTRIEHSLVGGFQYYRYLGSQALKPFNKLKIHYSTETNDGGWVRTQSCYLGFPAKFEYYARNKTWVTLEFPLSNHCTGSNVGYGYFNDVTTDLLYSDDNAYFRISEFQNIAVPNTDGAVVTKIHFWLDGETGSCQYPQASTGSPSCRCNMFYNFYSDDYHGRHKPENGKPCITCPLGATAIDDDEGIICQCDTEKHFVENGDGCKCDATNGYIMKNEKCEQCPTGQKIETGAVETTSLNPDGAACVCDVENDWFGEAPDCVYKENINVIKNAIQRCDQTLTSECQVE